MSDSRRTPAEVVPIDKPHQHTIKKRVVGLTEFERQLLLKELAEFAALLEELTQRAAQLAARVTDPSSARLDRPA